MVAKQSQLSAAAFQRMLAFATLGAAANLFYPFRPDAARDLPKSYAIGETWSSSADFNAIRQ